MSINTRALATFIFLVAIGLATTTAEEFATNGNSRQPASAKGKETVFVKPNLFKHTSKIRGPLEVSVNMPSQMPDKPGDIFVVKGTIKSVENLESVDFKWGLPSDVEIVNGEASGRIQALIADQPQEILITLKTLTGENHKVHFIAAASEHGARFADSAQYNTLIQTVLNDSKKTLSKAVESAAREEEHKPGFKVFH